MTLFEKLSAEVGYEVTGVEKLEVVNFSEEPRTEYLVTCKEGSVLVVGEETLNKVLAGVWQEGRSDQGFTLGHLPDRTGYGDCYCRQHKNPYLPSEELKGWCYEYENHPPHTVEATPVGFWGKPEYTCVGKYSCDKCYYQYEGGGEYPTNHEEECNGLGN